MLTRGQIHKITLESVNYPDNELSRARMLHITEYVRDLEYHHDQLLVELRGIVTMFGGVDFKAIKRAQEAVNNASKEKTHYEET